MAFSSLGSLRSTALMTCLLLDENEHIHFIDGGNGGYAMAAGNSSTNSTLVNENESKKAPGCSARRFSGHCHTESRYGRVRSLHRCCGNNTASMTWMTPFVPTISVITTFAGPAVTPSSLTVTVRSALIRVTGIIAGYEVRRQND